MDRLRIAALMLAALGLSAPAALAQDPATPRTGVVDRVIAIVGDSAVLKTDLDEEVLRTLAESGQRELPQDSAILRRLYRQALDSRINELLLLQAAERDSVTVGENEVQQRVEQQVAQQRRAFGSELALTQALRAEGLTLPGYRDQIAQQVRRQGMIELYISKIQRDRRPPPVTEERARQFFEEQKDHLGERPATVTLQLVVVAPQASDSAKAVARAEAEKILARIKAGEDFAQLAKRYSQDPASKERGGDLGWFRRETMVQAFSDAVYAMPPGAVSGLVESIFGYHIIKLEKVKGAERQARHILISPELTEADAERTHTMAAEVLEKMRAGAPIDSLVKAYGDPADKTQGKIGPITMNQLPPPFDHELANAQTGDLVGPFALPDEPGSRWAVVKVSDRTEQGAYRWEDPVVHSQIRQQLERQLLIEELVRELRERTFVDVRL